MANKLSPREECVRANVALLRKVLKLSRPDFARIVQMPATTIKNYELGYRTVSLSYLQNIGAAYGYAIARRLVEPVLLSETECSLLVE